MKSIAGLHGRGRIGAIAALCSVIGLSMIFAPTASAQTAPTIVTFPWDWHIQVQPNVGTPADPVFGPPIEIAVWGTATARFSPPQETSGSMSAPPTFDLGPGGVGFDIPTAQPPPVGGTYAIPIEILQMTLTSMSPVVFPQNPTLPTNVIVRNQLNRPTLGRIENLQNLGNGTIALDSFFDVFVEIDLPQLGMTLVNDQPVRAGMSFGSTPNPDMNPVGDPLPELDVLWAPTWIWREGFGRDLLSPPAGELWDRWISIHGHVTPEPAALCMICLAAAGLAGSIHRRRTCH